MDAVVNETIADDTTPVHDARGFIPQNICTGQIIADALCGIVRSVLEVVRDAQDRPPCEDDIDSVKNDNNAVGITFRIDRDDVILPPLLRAHLAKSRAQFMTLILDVFFHSLTVTETGFSVTVRFDTDHGNHYWHAVKVPFSAVSQLTHKDSFLDMVPFLPDGVKETPLDTAQQRRSRRQIRRILKKQRKHT